MFIYLRSDGKRLSFIRKKAKDLFNKLEQEPELTFFQISKDKYPDLTDDKAGYVKMRVTLGTQEAYQNISIGGWSSPIVRPILTESLLYIHVYNVTLNLFRIIYYKFYNLRQKI